MSTKFQYSNSNLGNIYHKKPLCKIVLMQIFKCKENFIQNLTLYYIFTEQVLYTLLPKNFKIFVHKFTIKRIKTSMVYKLIQCLSLCNHKSYNSHYV